MHRRFDRKRLFLFNQRGIENANNLTSICRDGKNLLLRRVAVGHPGVEWDSFPPTFHLKYECKKGRVGKQEKGNGSDFFLVCRKKLALGS